MCHGMESTFARGTARSRWLYTAWLNHQPPAPHPIPQRRPLCVQCFSEHIAERCLACGEAINPTRDGGGKISVGDKHWHPPCFCCVGCKAPLQGKPCVPKGNLIYCKSCYKRVKRKMKAAASS
jgi:hypothetical protein